LNAECHAQIENFIDRIKHIKSIKLTYNKKKGEEEEEKKEYFHNVHSVAGERD
jgi:hypothetical protein